MRLPKLSLLLHFRIAALLLATSTARAEDLLQIFDLAADNDLVIRQARANYSADHTQLDQNRARLLPALDLTASSSRDSAGVDGIAPAGALIRTPTHSFTNGFNTKGYGVNMRQSVLNFESWYAFKSAQKGDDAVALMLVQAEQGLIMRIAAAYFDVLRAQANLDSFAAEDAASRQIHDQTRRRYDAGLIPLIDMYDSQTNADLAGVNLLVAQNDLRRRLKAMEVITDQPHTALAGLSGEFPVVVVDTPLPEWIALALDNNPTVRAAAVELDATTYAARAASAALLPSFDLRVGYNWNESANPFNFSDLPQERSNITLSFSMPIFAGGANRARMRQAHYTRDATEAAMLKTRRDNSEAVSNSYYNVETDVHAVAARAQAMKSAQSALNATQVGADAGTRNLIDVVLAQRTLYAAQREHANARFDYVMDTLALKQAAGTLNPQDLIDLNEWLVP